MRNKMERDLVLTTFNVTWKNNVLSKNWNCPFTLDSIKIQSERFSCIFCRKSYREMYTIRWYETFARNNKITSFEILPALLVFSRNSTFNKRQTPDSFLKSNFMCIWYKFTPCNKEGLTKCHKDFHEQIPQKMPSTWVGKRPS